MSPVRPLIASRRLAALALAACLLATTAAVVALVQGNWLGVVWVLLAGVSSNVAWSHVAFRRRERAEAARRAAGPAADGCCTAAHPESAAESAAGSTAGSAAD